MKEKIKKNKHIATSKKERKTNEYTPMKRKKERKKERKKNFGRESEINRQRK